MSLSSMARRQTLAAHGLTTGPQGYDLGALIAFLERRGWRWSTVPVAMAGGRPVRWRATVFAEATHPDPRVSVSGAQGRGPSEAAALAAALATLLRAAE